MNTAQKLTLAVGAVLLALNFVFPYTSYPIKEQSEDGLRFRSTVRTGFVPVWKALAEHEKATLKGNPFDDTIIQWPIVLAFAAGIVVLCAWSIYRLGRPGGA
jgi:hypothetical protein